MGIGSDNASTADVASFPIASLRQFLVPDSLLSLKCFEAASLPELESAINAWVQQTQSVIAVVGSISVENGNFLVGITFVPATR